MSLARRRVTDETGAVAIDWAVMTALIVGVAIAVTSVVFAGVERQSRSLSDALIAQISAGITAATSALTVTGVWNDPAASSRELANVERFSLSTVVDFTPDAEGIIFETGGSAWGTVLYQHDGVLYLQAGRGNGVGEASDRGEATWEVVEGTATIEGSLDANGGLALIVNGKVVDQSSFNAPRLAGGNAGSVGGANTTVASNRGGFTRRDEGHPGVEEIALFEGQTTGHERPAD
jgi:Flp pilus assembly pilin Flp